LGAMKPPRRLLMCVNPSRSARSKNEPSSVQLMPTRLRCSTRPYNLRWWRGGVAKEQTKRQNKCVQGLSVASALSGV
jgi:hypothetical protein